MRAPHNALRLPHNKARTAAWLHMLAHTEIARSPLQALILTFIALACLISGGFSRRSQSKRILVSIALMVSLLISTLGIENISAKNLRLVPLIYLHSLVTFLGSIFFMIRIPQYRPTTNAAMT